MNPLSIRARNYRTFENLDLDLPAGCSAILGANGVGKSSLVNIVDLALFGPDGRSWAPYLTQGVEDTELLVELVFEHAGETYRVRRGYSARGTGKTTLDLEIQRVHRDEDVYVWDPVTRESQTATQAYIEELLGLTRETFRASAMLVQGDGAAFTEAKPADRKRVLAAVLGLSRFDRYLELVKDDRKTAFSQIERLNGALGRADTELEAKPEVEGKLATSRGILADAEKAETAAKAELEQAAKAASELAERSLARAEAAAALTAARAEHAPLAQRTRDAGAAKTDLNVAQDEIRSLATAEQRAACEALLMKYETGLDGYRQAVAARQDAQRIRQTRETELAAITAQIDAKGNRVAEIESRIDELEVSLEAGEAEHCELCRQVLTATAINETLRKLKSESPTLAGEMAALRETAAAIQLPDLPAEPEPPVEVEQAIADVKTEIEKIRQDDLQRERLNGRIQILQERVNAAPDPAAVESAQAAVTAAEGALAALPTAVADGELQRVQALALTARARVEEERIRGDAAKADEARLAAELERLTALDEATKADREDRVALLGDVDRYLILERAYGRNGIPALIIQSAAIPSIEAEADRILAELGTSYRVELRTEKANQDGSVADALDVVVYTDRGERPYETFSGGERTRLNLALRIALARLLATRRGAESRILAIDEPEFLDRDGTAALAGVLKGLNGSFERVYLISHVPDLAYAFDNTLEVMKGEDGRSRIAA